MLLLLASLALAQSSPPDLTPARPVCLTADEVRARILDPLSHLVRCRDEVAILERERDDVATALEVVVGQRDEARAAAVQAEARVKRARRGQVTAGASGAGVAVLVVLLLVLL